MRNVLVETSFTKVVIKNKIIDKTMELNQGGKRNGK